MSIRLALGKFFKRYFFFRSWRCVVCKKEIFNESGFCDDCKNTLPFNDHDICDHCGRKLKVAATFCSTCKGNLIYLDKCRSAFDYDKPISTLIKRLKYDNGRYLVDVFSEYLANVYFKNFIGTDVITFVPATEKSIKKRGFNQSQLLAEKVGEKVLVPVVDCLVKVKETDRQAKLNREQRQKNLNQAFKVKDKALVKGKNVLIVDDVTTTGSTAHAISQKLKKAGAKEIYLLTIASVAPSDKY